MRRSARRLSVVAAVLVGGGLVSSALAPTAYADPDPTAATAGPDVEDAALGPAAVAEDPLVPVSGLLAEDDLPPHPPVVAPAAAPAPARPRVATPAPRPAAVLPVTGYHLSEGFGARGGSWSSGRHTGLDFAAPRGTPVRAVADGRVVSAGFDGPYGRAVVVRHADGTQTRYAHLSADTVSVGDRVLAGQRIGKVGSTGNTTGPHLHLEVITGSGFSNPARWLAAKGVRV